jgi:hypothetical protein
MADLPLPSPTAPLLAGRSRPRLRDFVDSAAGTLRGFTVPRLGPSLESIGASAGHEKVASADLPFPSPTSALARQVRPEQKTHQRPRLSQRGAFKGEREPTDNNLSVDVPSYGPKTVDCRHGAIALTHRPPAPRGGFLFWRDAWKPCKQVAK